MTKSNMANRYSPEVRARAVRKVLEHRGSYETQGAAIAAIAPKIGCIPQTLGIRVRRAENDSGMRDGMTSAIGSRRWNWRTVNFAKPMKSSGKHQRILRRRSSAARSSHDRLH